MSMVYQLKAGTTDVSVVIRIVDSADGTPETGVVFNTAGIDLEYRREGAASTDITEATLAALTTAHTDGGFLHIGNGYYRLDLPDAACASGASGVLVHGTVTGMVVIGCYIQLWTTDLSELDTNVDAILADTGTDGVVVASGSKTGYALSAAGVDAIWDEPLAEPAGVFNWATTRFTFRDLLQWIGALARNKQTQTSSTQIVRNDADSANLASSATSDDGTTTTRGEWT